ncbi:MAG: hypothetical protein FJX53_04810 [Alphaproteobacteria bacterium]|nr:hypothetical protein [Alphaproteobacteria bacterium]
MRQIPLGEIRNYIASGAERLDHLAGFLEKLPAGSLTLAQWYGYGTGCAVGLAVRIDPWFSAQGLRLEDAGNLKECRPVFAGHEGWAAVAAFFDLSVDAATALFGRAAYGGDVSPHPRLMARRVRQHLVHATDAVLAA